MTRKVYLQVPFDEKDFAKERGARWDNVRRQWYVEGGWDLTPFIERWDVYLDCPYAEKDQVKCKGAMFDNEKKQWFVRAGAENMAEFLPWLPEGSLRMVSSSSYEHSSPHNNKHKEAAHVISPLIKADENPAKRAKTLASIIKTENCASRDVMVTQLSQLYAEIPSSSSSAAVDYSALLPQNIDKIIQQWLQEEDFPFHVGSLVVGTKVQSAQLHMETSTSTTSACVFAGKPFFERIFMLLGCTVQWNDSNSVVEGARIPSDGAKVLLATVTGRLHSILRGERIALNILSRCSGVATAAANAVGLAQNLGWKGFISGTRDITPGFRVAENYGLIVGGAVTELHNPMMVLLKDYHIRSAGSIHDAVTLARSLAGPSQKIEVECQSINEAIEAATGGADIVLLHNFLPDQLKTTARAIKEQFPHLLIEARGKITRDNFEEYLTHHVDIISRQDLTKGYQTIDFYLTVLR